MFNIIFFYEKDHITNKKHSEDETLTGYVEMYVNDNDFIYIHINMLRNQYLR